MSMKQHLRYDWLIDLLIDKRLFYIPFENHLLLWKYIIPSLQDSACNKHFLYVHVHVNVLLITNSIYCTVETNSYYIVINLQILKHWNLSIKLGVISPVKYLFSHGNVFLLKLCTYYNIKKTACIDPPKKKFAAKNILSNILSRLFT